MGILLVLQVKTKVLDTLTFRPDDGAHHRETSGDQSYYISS